MSEGEIVRKGNHQCKPPIPFCDGSIWRCFSCRKYWRSKLYGNEVYDRWVRIYWLGRRLRGLGR